MSIPLTCLKVVDHGDPLLLLGADLMRAGRPSYYWRFDCIGIGEMEGGKHTGYINFRKDGKVETVKLLNVPTGASNKKGGGSYGKAALAAHVKAVDGPLELAARLYKQGKM